MPIRPENRRRYGKRWPEISRRIRERDGQRCKWCGLPNGAWVVRWNDPTRESVLLMTKGTREEAIDTAMIRMPDDFPSYDNPEERPAGRIVRIVLTVAHLDHVVENMADENLAALCQRCHLNHDRKDHNLNRLVNLDAKRGQLRLELEET